MKARDRNAGPFSAPTARDTTVCGSPTAPSVHKADVSLTVARAHPPSIRYTAILLQTSYLGVFCARMARMDTRFKAASLASRFGLSVGPQAPESSVRSLIGQMHPRSTQRPLIRLGGDADGGYLVPDDLDGIVGCFSPGVCETSTFEADLLARDIPCCLADASVNAPPISHPRLEFRKKFIGTYNSDEYITMDSWIDSADMPEGDLLLQMDIEGAEWPVLLNISEASLRRFRILVVEFHDIDRILDKTGFRTIANVFERLLQHYVVVHIHPNNWNGIVRKNDIELPRALEITFLRSDRSPAIGCDHAHTFPHPLDVTNCDDRPDIVLPKIWHS